MAKEIERKFLVASNAWRDAAGAASHLLQAYVILAPGRSLRVRIADGRVARLTLKLGDGGLERDEYEYEVPLADARELIRLRLGNLIEKTRYRVPFGKFVWEVDVFEGALAGLVVAEVEMTSSADRPALPGWLGSEVTGVAEFGNRSLAVDGLPADVRA